MSERQSTLRYLAFFEALAECEEGSPTWHALSAGLVTLRLVDAWLARGGSEPGGDQWAVQAVRQQVEQVPLGDPTRTILVGVVDELARPGAAHAARVVPRLMAYGRALDFGGRWAPASEVYTSVLALVDPAIDTDLAIGAQFRLAYCQRVLGNLDEAELAYAAAGHLSRIARDEVGALRSEVGLGKVAMARGNIPAAEQAFDGVIARADQSLVMREDTAMREFRATVLHDLSTVYHQRKRHEPAIQVLDEALRDTRSPSARDRLIADIASNFLELGLHEAARDSYLIVATTAEEQFSRWAATNSLLYLAVVDGMEPAFEQYRRELADQPLGPEQAAHYLLNTGMGYRRFGRFAEGRDVLDQALAIAERHGFNALVFEIEAEQRRLSLGERESSRNASHATPVGLVGIVDSMRRMREVVLAGH